MKLENMHSKLLSSVVLILLAGIFGNLHGQSPDALDNLRNVMPPSPNSSAFARYGEWPVNLYTGVPSVSIPVTTAKGRSVSVPISLSYHAAGNRVGDIASWVGLGWSLNAGGVISRSIKGLNDEAGLFVSSTSYSDPNDLSSSAPQTTTLPRISATANNLSDSEEDSYNFSALGRSYRLLVMANNVVYTIPHSNIKFINNPITGPAGAADWTVILEDGTTLLFGGGANFVENTSNPNFSSSDGKGISYISSWHLKSIIATNGETIKFTYTSSSIEQDSYFSQSDNIKYLTSSSGTGTTGPTCTDLSNSTATSSHASIQLVTTQSLKSITTDLMRLDFLTTPNRQDLYGGAALSEVRVFSKLSNTYIEKYLFNTGYSQAVTGNDLLIGTTNTSYFYKRLRLTGFQKLNVQDTTLQPQKWLFTYNAQNLPSRRSFAQDHWGFFNGATSNTTLLPREYFALPALPNLTTWMQTTGFMPGYHDFGGNRDGNAAYMQAEILTQVNYPTGGYSQFTYEPNSIPVSKETFTDTNLELDLNLTYTSGPSGNVSTGTFAITTPGYVTMNLSSQISASILQDQPGATVSCVVLDQGNNNVGSTAIDGIYSFNLLNAGTYTFKVSVNTTASNLSSGDYVNATAILTYSRSNGTQNFNQITGGLRVTSIIDYDGVTGAYNPKYYQYANPLVINAVDPVNDYIATQQGSTSTQAPPGQGGEGGGTVLCYYLNTIRNSSTRYAAGSIQGGTTGYGQVTTLNGLNGANGSTVSIFNSEPDSYSSDPHAFPYPTPDSRDHRRGLLLTQKDLNAQQVMLKRTDNAYSFNAVGLVNGFKAGYLQLVAPDLCQDIYKNCGIVQGWGRTTAEQVMHLNTVQTAYDANGQNPVVTKTTFYYDTPANTQPVRTVTRDGRGDSLTVYARTALEKTAINTATPLSGAASTAIDAMITQNMVGQVLQHEKYNNSTLISRETTNYNVWNSTMPLPQNAIVQNGSGTPFTSLTVNNYDPHGNLIQLTPLDGVNKSYIWDYDSATHPIAEVTNAGQLSYAYTSFEGDGNGNWSFAATPTTAAAFTGTYSLSLTSNTVTISGLSSSAKYTVTLWAKSGSVSITGSTFIAGDVRNGWTNYQASITGTTSIVISGSGYIDELRLCPVGALMTTYTYGPFGVTSSTDANNVTTFYQYDGFGRLAVVRDDKNKVLKTYKYNYKSN